MTTASQSTPETKKKAEAFFKTGGDAALKGNFDYAIQMCRDACKLVPENLVYRQALRGVERRKFGNDPSKVGRMAGTMLQPIRLRIKMARANAKTREQWLHILDMSEEALAHNPWDVGSSRNAADAAEHLNLPAVAEWLLESVHAQGAEDAVFLRHEAHAHELNGSWQKAISCWEKVRKLVPGDENAIRQINGLSASATISRSGLGEAIQRASDFNKPASSSEVNPHEIEENRLQAMSPEERFLKEVEAYPERIGLYLEHADHHKRHRRLDEAEKALALGLKKNPGDAILLSAHADVQIARLQKAIDVWTKQVRENPDDLSGKSKLAKLTTMLQEYEIKEFKRRADDHPEDLNLRLELGIRYARVGRHDEAIAEFQQARSSPSLKVQALLNLGLSHEAEKRWKLAERQYADAMKAAEPDDVATLNDLNYRLGRINESLGNTAKAEEHYNEVAANDYSYRDIAKRLRELGRASRDG